MWERRIRTLSYEEAYAFAPDGTLILDTTDLAPASVGFTANQLSLLREALGGDVSEVREDEVKKIG